MDKLVDTVESVGNKLTGVIFYGSLGCLVMVLVNNWGQLWGN